jgi:hypothetical protein
MAETVENKKQPAIRRALLIVACVIVFLIIFIPFSSTRDRQPPYRALCGNNLRTLLFMFMIYEADHKGIYPPADKWCDILIENSKGELTKESKYFKCKADKVGPCSYAMNPNCEPNSPGDVVSLFESKPGWNQYGGVELLNFDNHEGKGCSILFNDGNVEFIKAEDANKLRWK